MTRAKAITWDNLELRAPAFVGGARGLRGGGARARRPRRPGAPAGLPAVPARGMEVPNRFVVSPMCQYSAEDGLPGDFHLVHYGARGMGGAGLLFTEMTCVSPEARITPGCTGLWNDAQEAAWTRIVGFVHAQGRRAWRCNSATPGGRARRG
jgi:anthraniloyl-CoA monooxygenase